MAAPTFEDFGSRFQRMRGVRFQYLDFCRSSYRIAGFIRFADLSHL